MLQFRKESIPQIYRFWPISDLKANVENVPLVNKVGYPTFYHSSFIKKVTISKSSIRCIDPELYYNKIQSCKCLNGHSKRIVVCTYGMDPECNIWGVVLPTFRPRFWAWRYWIWNHRGEWFHPLGTLPNPSRLSIHIHP